MTKKDIATWLKKNNWRRVKTGGLSTYTDPVGNSLRIIVNAQVVYYRKNGERYGVAFPIENVYINPDTSGLCLVHLNGASYIELPAQTKAGR